MNDVKYSINSYTMNQTAIYAGAESIKDKEYFTKQVNKIIATREKTVKELEELGFTCLPSKANFVFAKHDKAAAKDIFEQLKARDIFVRYFNQPRIDNFLRITIGTDKEMEELVSALKDIIG